MKLSLFEKDIIVFVCVILYLVLISIYILYINDDLNCFCCKKKEEEMKLINDNSSNNKDKIIYYNALYNE